MSGMEGCLSDMPSAELSGEIENAIMHRHVTMQMCTITVCKDAPRFASPRSMMPDQSVSNPSPSSCIACTLSVGIHLILLMESVLCHP